MRRFVFAHLADAHVGAWARNPDLRERLRASVLRAIEVATQRNAEFLLISGDLFHTPAPEPSEAAPVAAALRRFVEAGHRIYVIYGSHDYVAHRTSWLDVLAEAGVFVRVAPESVRADGSAWTLSWTLDEPTGVLVSGISGRSHGLDREYFHSMDSTAFTATPGFKIFQFHAAVEEYLPAHLREKIHGIRIEDLPPGCGYYAGGHIHFTYEGTGPGGGLLVNPGAVFGTSRTDIENGEAGRTHRGLAIVTVEEGHPSVELVDTMERGTIRTVDIDVSGRTADAIAALVVARVREEGAPPGTLILPRLHGVLASGKVSPLDIGPAREELARDGVTVQVDVRDVEGSAPGPGAPVAESVVEDDEVARLLGPPGARVPWLEGPAGERLVHDLLSALGVPKADGESNLDYSSARRAEARRLLGVFEPTEG
ncbi:MAG: DNA repair exonuclease [Thermoplasmata archaeon]|nr:DNA repair exonuclease [Thermoplasmata archaeon]